MLIGAHPVIRPHFHLHLSFYLIPPFLPNYYPSIPLSLTVFLNDVHVHTFLDVDFVLTMRVHLLDRPTARWKRRKG